MHILDPLPLKQQPPSKPIIPYTVFRHDFRRTPTLPGAPQTHKGHLTLVMINAPVSALWALQIGGHGTASLTLILAFSQRLALVPFLLAAT